MDLFPTIFNALSPYMFGILKIALATTLFSNSIKIIRTKGGGAVSGNPYSGITTAIIGYLLGRGIPITVELIDVICNEILANLKVN